jgi:hypothetical protein
MQEGGETGVSGEELKASWPHSGPFLDLGEDYMVTPAGVDMKVVIMAVEKHDWYQYFTVEIVCGRGV